MWIKFNNIIYHGEWMNVFSINWKFVESMLKVFVTFRGRANNAISTPLTYIRTYKQPLSLLLFVTYVILIARYFYNSCSVRGTFVLCREKSFAAHFTSYCQLLPLLQCECFSTYTYACMYVRSTVNSVMSDERVSNISYNSY